MMQVLVLLEEDNTLEIDNSYIYNNVYFDEYSYQRKVKGSFRDALASVFGKTSAEHIIKSDKVFVFRLRSDLHLMAFARLPISKIENIDWLNDISKRN